MNQIFWCPPDNLMPYLMLCALHVRSTSSGLLPLRHSLKKLEKRKTGCTVDHFVQLLLIRDFEHSVNNFIFHRLMTLKRRKILITIRDSYRVLPRIPVSWADNKLKIEP